MPLPVLIAVPMYSNAACLIPFLQALQGKRAAPGTVLPFMIAVIAMTAKQIIRNVPHIVARRSLEIRGSGG